MRNLVSVITGSIENAAKFFSLTSQNQKETAGIPEYARKGRAALSRENFSLRGEIRAIFSIPKWRPTRQHPLP